MGKIKVEKLTHIGMFASDVEKCAKFYMDYLDFEITREVKKDNGEHFIFLTNNDLVVEFINFGDQPETGPIHHFALDVTGGLEDFVAKLEADGIKINEPGIGYYPQDDGTTKKMVFFKGPAGENVELFEYVKTEDLN